MKTLQKISKNQVQFLIDLDYNNILGRLKYTLGTKSTIFSDIYVKSREIIWSVKDDSDFVSLLEADDQTKKLIITDLTDRLKEIKDIIQSDDLLKDFHEDLLKFPSEAFVFYDRVNINNIVVTAWGCKLLVEETETQANSVVNQRTHDEEEIPKIEKIEAPVSESEVTVERTDEIKEEISEISVSESLTKGTINNTLQKESGSKSATGWLIATYIFALLGGFLGIIIGIIVYRDKEYKSSHRTLGLVGAILAIFSMIFWKVAAM